MGRKLLLGVLMIVIMACLAVILVISFRPRESKKVVTTVVEEGTIASVLPRRPPPRATPVPATPTPEPTPLVERIERRLRVRPEDYPFRVSGKPTQAEGRMRVTLDVKNKSGRDWPVAYLTISSAYHPERSQYRIDNWRREEVRSIDYVFPASEMDARLRELQVEDVSTVPGADSIVDGGVASPGHERVRVEGTVGLWHGLKGALGVPPPPPEEMAALLANVSPEAAKEVSRGTGLTINLEGLGQINTIPLPVDGFAGAERDIRIAYNEAVQAAYGAVEGVRALGKALSDAPWDEAMAAQGVGTQELEGAGKQINVFQAKAVLIHQIHAKTGSTDTAQLVARLKEVSDVLMAYQEALERQVRAAHPKFSLMP